MLDRASLRSAYFDLRGRVEVFVTAFENPARRLPSGISFRECVDALEEVARNRLHALVVEGAQLGWLAGLVLVDTVDLALAFGKPHPQPARRNPDLPGCDLDGGTL